MAKIATINVAEIYVVNINALNLVQKGKGEF